MTSLPDQFYPILIIGASSTIGKFIFQKLINDKNNHSVLGTYFRNEHPPRGTLPLDITNKNMVLKTIDNFRPRLVIHFAALADVFVCENSPTKAYEINVKGSQNIALACLRVGAKLIYISTDYVFDGVNGPFDESDKPNPINVYGSTKLQGEKESAALLGKQSIILRIAHVYKRGYKHFDTGMLSFLGDTRATVEIPDDLYTTPTDINSILSLIVDLLKHGETGVFHLSDGTVMTWYELIYKLATICGIDREKIMPVSVDKWQKNRKIKVRWPMHGGIVSIRRKKYESE